MVVVIIVVMEAQGIDARKVLVDKTCRCRSQSWCWCWKVSRRGGRKAAIENTCAANVINLAKNWWWLWFIATPFEHSSEILATLHLLLLLYLVFRACWLFIVLIVEVAVEEAILRKTFQLLLLIVALTLIIGVIIRVGKFCEANKGGRLRAVR